MSVLVMAEVFKTTLGSSSRKTVALRLADFADDEGRGVWPTVGRIARECELSERTVQRTLAEFVDDGILIVVAEGGRGVKSSTRYDFDLNAVRRLREQEKRSENKGDTMSPYAETLGDTDDAKGDTDDSLGCHGVTQTVIEPSDNHPLRESVRESVGKEEDRSKALLPSFWKLVKAWPGFDGMPKEPAIPHWMALTDDERAEALRKRDTWFKALKDQRKSHVPAPSTYLTQKLWKDVAEPATADKPERIEAKPFGKLWSAARFKVLLAGPVNTTFPLTKLEQSMIAGGQLDEAATMLDKRSRYGWPVVNFMHERASTGQSHYVSPSLETLAAQMVQVRVNGDEWKAWQAEHKARGWPWLPDPGRAEWAYFPVGGPDGLDEFKQAVLGNNHDGNR